MNINLAQRNKLLKEYNDYTIDYIKHLLSTRKIPDYYDVSDFYDVAIFALIKAIETYDEKKKTQFKTWATTKIYFAIREEMRKMGTISRDRCKIKFETVYVNDISKLAPTTDGHKKINARKDFRVDEQNYRNPCETNYTIASKYDIIKLIIKTIKNKTSKQVRYIFIRKYILLEENSGLAKKYGIKKESVEVYASKGKKIFCESIMKRHSLAKELEAYMR